MEILKITSGKKKYLELLLLADEQESMIDRYLERGDMFVLDDCGVKAECVVTREGEGVYELKNIAVVPEFQRRGYGRMLVDYVAGCYPDCKKLFAGTGDCPPSLSFYKSCGFSVSHRVKNFFVDNYDHEIYDCGIRLVDMVYLMRKC
ncbi:GNAT family N-acetyltransferase [Treponema sp.]|uniref:GNAT family N-acetyltransferase n=1 Tax=Treponema sp. TaxID=166 RepID=UPI003F0C2D75